MDQVDETSNLRPSYRDSLEIVDLSNIVYFPLRFITACPNLRCLRLTTVYFHHEVIWLFHSSYNIANVISRSTTWIKWMKHQAWGLPTWTPWKLIWTIRLLWLVANLQNLYRESEIFDSRVYLHWGLNGISSFWLHKPLQHLIWPGGTVNVSFALTLHRSYDILMIKFSQMSQGSLLICWKIFHSIWVSCLRWDF